jgi:hypothetical protein
MESEHLPANLRTTPLPDLVVADVVDQLIGDCERLSGAVLFLLCDEDDRIVVPVVIDEMPAKPPAHERRQCIEVVTRAMVGGGGSVLIVIARSGRAAVTAADRLWLSDAIEVCRDRVRLLGVHVSTTRTTFAVEATHV